MFELMGYSVLTAQSGEEALEVIGSNAVDAVVVDYLMPGMDGEETARRIRGMHTNPPIILSSGCRWNPARLMKVGYTMRGAPSREPAAIADAGQASR
jgi:DNA-binding response OmpR family regulator